MNSFSNLITCCICFTLASFIWQGIVYLNDRFKTLLGSFSSYYNYSTAIERSFFMCVGTILYYLTIK